MVRLETKEKLEKVVGKMDRNSKDYDKEIQLILIDLLDELVDEISKLKVKI